MDLARPYTAISSSLDTAVLSFLAGTTRPMTGREVARKLGLASHEGVRQVLNRLVDHGLVSREELGGNSLLYLLNRDHVAFPAVERMAAIRSEFIARLRGEFKSWSPKPVQATLFGSAARRDGDTKSDIDLFVVRPSATLGTDERWANQITGLEDRILAWSGNHAGIVEFAEEGIEKFVQDHPQVLDELLADGIALFGAELKQLFAVHA